MHKPTKAPIAQTTVQGIEQVTNGQWRMKSLTKTIAVETADLSLKVVLPSPKIPTAVTLLWMMTAIPSTIEAVFSNTATGQKDRFGTVLTLL
jgi:hypothetical protein